jgi:hypothetical protein
MNLQLALRMTAALGVGALLLLTLPVEGRASGAGNLAASPLSDLTISASQRLHENLTGRDITIDPGVTLTTDGFSIFASGTIDNKGSIVTGSAPDRAYPLSYGGSGGGAQSLTFCPYDRNGFYTLVPGGRLSCTNYESGQQGRTPLAPVVTSAEISSWLSLGIRNYLSGAGGGAVAHYIPSGDGGFGVYIQAKTLVAGRIIATGQPGQGTCSGIGLSGAGGGGVILLAYGSGGYTPGHYYTGGGAGAPNCDGGLQSGEGGSGQALEFAYGGKPPVPFDSVGPSYPPLQDLAGPPDSLLLPQHGRQLFLHPPALRPDH